MRGTKKPLKLGNNNLLHYGKEVATLELISGGTQISFTAGVILNIPEFLIVDARN